MASLNWAVVTVFSSNKPFALPSPCSIVVSRGQTVHERTRTKKAQGKHRNGTYSDVPISGCCGILRRSRQRVGIDIGWSGEGSAAISGVVWSKGENGRLRRNCAEDRGSQAFCENVSDMGKELQAAAEDGDEVNRIILSQAQRVPSDVKRMFIFGFGYTTCALASYLKASNWVLSGTCRSEESKSLLEKCGYSVHLFDSCNTSKILRHDAFRDLQQASHWLTSVPPQADICEDPVLANHAGDLRSVVEAGRVCWIGYLSSTGVYGNWQGNWVDEESEPRPVEQRSKARMAAEKSWLKFGTDHGVPVHVFRLGGIYGPGRSAVDSILKKGPLSDQQRGRERRQFISRIHVADICQTLLSSMQSICPRRIYNVVDDDPTPRMEVFAYAQNLLNSQEDFAEDLHERKVPSDMAFNRASSDYQVAEKRVSNKRIKEELNIKLFYATYRSGLAAVYKAVLDSRTA